MVSRSRKLSAAGTVLALGLALAWPLRLADDAAPLHGGVSRLPPSLAVPPTSTYAGLAFQHAAPESPRGLAALEISTGGPPSAPGPAASPVSGAPPAIGAELDAGLPVAKHPERIHVIHEGDRLDRLAKRYLGDEGRAVEIFDLNREVLVNPHLLPIGVELRIPRRPDDATQ